MNYAYIGGCFQRTKITHKASDVAVNLQLYWVVQSCTTTHISADVQGITLNALCTTISGGRTKHLDIFRRITGFTSDFLSFIVVELIRFFHGALQLSACGCKHLYAKTNLILLTLCAFPFEGLDEITCKQGSVWIKSVKSWASLARGSQLLTWLTVEIK